MRSKVSKDKPESVDSIEMQVISEESEDEEEEDEEDEVFIKSGKYENGTSAAKKPLIKNRPKKNGKSPAGGSGENDTEIRTGKPTAKRCCGPICCIVMGIKSLVGVVALTVVLTNYFTHSDWLFWHFPGLASSPDTFVGCQRLEVTPVWQVKFPKLIVEGSTRMLKVNDDDVLDVVVGFGTGADGYDIPDFVCDIYFDGEKPCLGGILALDGRTGAEIWRLWTKHEIFALTCQTDLDGDGFIDCLAGGRAGVFLAVSIRTGSELWTFGSDHAIVSDLMSVYEAQFIQDVDNDGVPDVLAVHGGDALSDPNPKEHMFGRLILVSGKSGQLLQWMPTPDQRESYYPPQVTTSADGRQVVIFGTGSTKHGGGLYAKALLDIYRKNLTNVKMIYKDQEKGILSPAALVDLNNDGVQDIVLATMNSKVLAFDGANFKPLWNVSIDNHQSSCSVAVGLYDEDNIPDIMVKYNYGEDFPIYEYEKTVILSGKNGSVISPEMINTLPAKSTPIVISMEGQGHDIFLHWSINCQGHKGEKIKFGFRSSTHMFEKAQADLCQALFKTGQDAKFVAMSRRFPNGIPIYNSTDWQEFEHKNSLNTSYLAAKYLKDHPELADNWNRDSDEDPYSVLPYKKKDFENYIKLLQEENEREFNGQRPVIDPGTLNYNDLLDMDYDIENESGGLNPNIGVPVYREQDKLMPGSGGGSGGAGLYPAQQQVLYPQLPVYPFQQSGQPGQGPMPPGFASPNRQPLRPRQKRPDNSLIADYLRQRVKRAAGRDLYQGIHKQSSTGSLAPPIIAANDTMDVVLATYWVYPPKLDILQENDLRCIEHELKLLEKKSEQEGATILDAVDQLDKQVEAIESKCLDKSGHQADPNLIYETPSDYDPLSVNMGTMMVYRFSVRCICDEKRLAYGQKCSKMLPYQNQGWAAFMGRKGDSKFGRNWR